MVSKGKGATCEECAEIAKVSRYELQQWRTNPDADNLISNAINYNLEEALGTIAAAAPTLSKRLVDIGLSSSTRPYTAVDEIKTSLTVLQSGVINRENKSELKKSREAMERIEGEPLRMIDI